MKPNNLADLVYCNPFLPERVEIERRILGSQFEGAHEVWSFTERPSPNLLKLRAAAEKAEPEEDVVLYLLYDRTREAFDALIDARRTSAPFYAEFVSEAESRLGRTALPLPHLFAVFYQIRRAFRSIYRNIIGASHPAAALRAAVWQSIFTHDMRRYWKSLYDRMGDATTLITGASGTGKEIVARAIADSRYLPFDPKSLSFSSDTAFHALNLSALSPTLLESELFGHKKGSFTGAFSDRVGWLETCPATGTIFLDEIGDVDAAIQVKLLRVLQTRTFQRIGETHPRRFQGKIVAATNRDLAHEMRQSRFRADFYYRLCSDSIATPPLRDQLKDLPNLVQYVARRVAGDSAPALAQETLEWIRRRLGNDYAWPGNFRELEQCVRSILIRREYHPPRSAPGDPAAELAQAVTAGTLTADELLRRYCTLVYSQTGNYEETARRLVLDRRTVKSKVDPRLLGRHQKP